jgi:AraC family transcriptional regulator, regulatory protein of adaptative response / methylated-DNA-[protein]-cysteine methyltransferase
MPRSHRQTGRRELIRVPIPTAAGTFTAHFSELGLARLDFPSNVPPASRREEIVDPISAWTTQTAAAVEAILSGQPPAEIPPLDLRAGTEFQQRVWSALRAIRAGDTRSYGELARELQAPGATRAVGSACGANPIPLLIPCHRVVASGGKLGGFSGGLDWKKRLLAAEGVLVRNGELPLERAARDKPAARS